MQISRWRILKSSLLLAAVAALICAGWLILPKGGAERYDLTPAAKIPHENLRHVLRAVAWYREQHGGEFPYDDRGAEYALYKLRPYLDARYLACVPVADVKYAPFWNEKEKRVHNSGWAYLNVADPLAIAPNEIIIASRMLNAQSPVYFADRIGAIMSRRMSGDGAKLLVGSFVTDESFIVASKDTFEEWERLGPRGNGWQVTSSGTGKAIRTTHPARNVAYEYVYSEGRPSARRIHCDGREICERLLLDDIGRITKIERTPDDWEEIWRTCNPEAKP